jgi:hypothetical protein
MGNARTPSHPRGEITTMVIAGGNKNSATGTSERQDGAAPIFDPMRHSQQDVNLEDLWFSGMSVSPTAFSQNSFMGPPDPGSIVAVLKQAGDAGGIVLGLSNTVRKGSGGAGGGGQDIMNGPILQQLQSEKIPVNIPPKIKETEERGAKVRKIEEKGEEHSLDLLDGLPIHGALFQMTGFMQPETKKVPTAKTKNDKMMTNQMMQQLAGQVMSMAQMFQGLASKGKGGGGGGAPPATGGGSPSSNTYMQDIMGSVNPQMRTAINSMSKLVQGLDTGDGTEYVTGSVVHEETFLENSANLLSQVTTISDLMQVMQRLQWDTSLFGHDKLEPTEYVIDTAHGTAKQTVSFDGTINVTYDANTMNNMNGWSNVISSPEQSPGAGSSPANQSGGSGGGNQAASMMQQMFGKSSQIMQEMFKRLSPKQEKEAKTMHKKLNQSDTAQKLNTIFKETAEGGEPLKKDHFESGVGGVGTSQFSLEFLGG